MRPVDIDACVREALDDVVCIVPRVGREGVVFILFSDPLHLFRVVLGYAVSIVGTRQ